MKSKKITGWVLGGLIFLLLGASASDKIIASQHALQMSTMFGIPAGVYQCLGVIELLSAALFLYSRTSILGTLLLSSYLGGAIATHLLYHQSILFPIAIEAIVWITAVIRFPELTQRLLNKSH